MYKDFSEKYYSTIEEYVDFHENGTEKHLVKILF